MPQPDAPRFNLRLTPELLADLARARRDSGRSMNAEILARLNLTFAPDPALQIAEVLRPLLSPLSEVDRSRVVEAVEILAKGSAKRSSRRSRNKA